MVLVLQQVAGPAAVFCMHLIVLYGLPFLSHPFLFVCLLLLSSRMDVRHTQIGGVVVVQDLARVQEWEHAVVVQKARQV